MGSGPPTPAQPGQEDPVPAPRPPPPPRAPEAPSLPPAQRNRLMGVRGSLLFPPAEGSERAQLRVAGGTIGSPEGYSAIFFPPNCPPQPILQIHKS